jgi:hemolysin activation/secretion protein
MQFSFGGWRLCGWLLFFAGSLTWNSGSAQTPGQVQPGQIERQLQRPPEPRTQPGPFQAPFPAQTVPANADAVKFTLLEGTVAGATVYGEEALRAYFQPHLNREVSLADVYEIAHKLTIRYRTDGYILSQVIVPEQEVKGGRIRLQAVEGYVADIRIDSGHPPVPPLVQAYADQIKAARPLTAAALERYMLLMNDLPGAFARATLVPAQAEQGAADLVVEFSQRPVAGGLTVDNRGSKALGPVRWWADADLNSVFGLQERTGVKVVTTANRELDYVVLSHDEQIGKEGGKLGLALSYVRSKPDEGQTFIPLNLETASNSGSATFSYPVIRSRRQNLYLRAGFSSYNGYTELFGMHETQDHIRALRLGATYDLADALRGVNIVDVEIGQGLRAFGASRAGDPQLSRTEGKPDFTKVSLYAARLQSLSPSWSVLAAINAQYAFSDLLAPELYSFGGEQFGRGYDPSELVGDHGAAMKLELRYSGTTADPQLLSYTAYGFYDAGFVRQRTPAGLAASESASSAGIGVRLSLGRYVSAFAEVAKPLTKVVAAEGDRNPRFYAGLAVRF